jgi:RecA-family ATPase
LVERDDATGQLLATVGRDGIVKPTPLYDALMAKAGAVKPICIAIDNVADVFGGNEIDRSQVRQFVRLMRRLAIAADGYVIMSAHPSLQGISSKSGLSGSTQWHNSVRARAYLRSPNEKTENGKGSEEDAPKSDARVLEFMKSNYSALAEQITLRWANGLYLPAPTPSAPEQAAANATANKLFLNLLDKHTREGANVSGNENARNYAPRMFAKTKEAKAAGIDQRAFKDALSRLAEADEVRAEPYGKPSDGTKRLVRRVLETATPGDTPATPPSSPSPHGGRQTPGGHTPSIEEGGVAPGVRDVAKPFRVISPAPPGTVCVHCHRADGAVMKIRPASAGAKAEPLHEDCAERWFGDLA